MRKITAIELDTPRPTWVRALFQRHNGQNGMEITSDPNMAKDFKNEGHANEIIRTLHNPLDREFKIVKMEVLQPRSEFVDDSL